MPRFDANPKVWHKAFSSKTGQPYYHHKVSKATFWSEVGLPHGWAFVWNASKQKEYFNIFTGDVCRSPSAIPKVVAAPAGGKTARPVESTDTRPQSAPEPIVSQKHEDTPRVAGKRQDLILEIRQKLAAFVHKAGPLNGKTKTAKAVLKEGEFIGLAGLYGRWVFNQKRDEGVGIDPLLPTSVPVDTVHLPSELVEAGLGKEEANEASALLSREAKLAVEILKQVQIEDLKAGSAKWANETLSKLLVFNGNNVTMNFCDVPLTMTRRHFEKLAQMYRRLPSNDPSKNLRRIFCVLQRYESLSGDSAGYQMALTEAVFDQLHDLFGVSHECFASPLNAYYPNFCSLYFDTDQFFGSKGSFFNFFPTEGSFEANPPFVDETMTANVKHITACLEASQKPLCFVIIVPGWDDCESYKLTKESKFLRAHITWDKMGHQYKSGIQYKMDDSTRYKDSRVNTFVFIMQNEAGSQKWPVTSAKIKTLQMSKLHAVSARAREGHDMLWQSVDATHVQTSSSVERSAPDSSNNSNKRTRDSNQASAEDHYNNKKLRAARSDVKNRQNHSLSCWYAFSNWCKSTLISSYCPEGGSALDLACGAGGDLFKFKRRDLRAYVGVDIAKESLKDEAHKVQDGNITFPVQLGHAELGKDSLFGPEAQIDVWSSSTGEWTPATSFSGQENQFDFASMQFAMHYMMESEDRLRNFFRSWVEQLKPGGYFVATSTDAHSMAQIMAQHVPDSTSGETVVQIKDQLGRVNCQITFPKSTRDALMRNNGSTTSDFGMTCQFKLTEHREDGDFVDAVNAKEWLIPVESVVQIAAEFNLLLLGASRFDQHLRQGVQNPQFRQSLSRMKVAGIRAHEWKLASMYTTMVFQKALPNRVAIIVPFRDLHVEQKRSMHLKQFVPYMVKYMAHCMPKVNFRIYIVEQSNDGMKFNRGKLLNVGFDVARRAGFTTFIFHDVDLLPSESLRYAYSMFPKSPHPIHIARVWERYNANDDYCGGICSWNQADFERINGFPNNYWGWGGEDDEMQKRAKACGLRFQPLQQGEIKDLEYMTLEEKLQFLKRQQSGKTDNKWKCMVKTDLLQEHDATWKQNGLSDLTYSVNFSDKSLHPSGLASRVNVDLPLNGHWSDTKTAWGDSTGTKTGVTRKPPKKHDGAKSQWANAVTAEDSAAVIPSPAIAKSAETERLEHGNGVPTVRSQVQFQALFSTARSALPRVKKIMRNCMNLLPLAEKLAKNGISDHDIYVAMHALHWRGRVTEKSADNVGGEGYDRFGDRGKTVGELAQESVIGKIGNMLDVGCAEGGITSHIGRALGLSPTNVHGCDIRAVEKEDPDFKFTLYDGINLPYAEGTFDVVVVLMAFHHMTIQEDVMANILRVLRPGGVMIIREHDCSLDSTTFDPEIALALDLQHALFARVTSNPVEWKTFCDDYYAKYRPRNEWTNMLQKQGFEHVLDSQKHRELYEPHGVKMWYWAMYRRPMK